MPPSACPFRSNPETIANRNARMLTAIGRLRPGATLQQVQGDLDAASHRLVAADPAEYDPPRTGFRTAALMVRDELTRRARPTLLMLLAATGFVLLLVAANVANLTLARVLGRERELAVRAALGAGPRRIARQLLTESTILAVAGGGLGLLVAWLVRDLLVAFTVRFTPRAEEIATGAAVFAFALAVSVVTGLASGVYAASGFSRNMMVRLKADTTSMRSALIAVQVAVAFVLLAGAGLLARSAIALQDVDAGFHADRVLTMRIDLDFVKYDTQASRRDFFRAVLERVQAEPGVRTAALSFDVPLDITHTMRRELLVEGGLVAAAACAGGSEIHLAGLLRDDRHVAAERPPVHRRPTRQRRRASPSSTLPWRSITFLMPIPSAAASRSMTARPGSPSSGSSTTCASTISR